MPEVLSSIFFYIYYFRKKLFGLDQGMFGKNPIYLHAVLGRGRFPSSPKAAHQRAFWLLQEMSCTMWTELLPSVEMLYWIQAHALLWDVIKTT